MSEVSLPIAIIQELWESELKMTENLKLSSKRAIITGSDGVGGLIVCNVDQKHPFSDQIQQ